MTALVVAFAAGAATAAVIAWLIARRRAAGAPGAGPGARGGAPARPSGARAAVGRTSGPRAAVPSPTGVGRQAAPPVERTQESLLAAFRPEELRDPSDALREDQRLLADALRDAARRRGATAAMLWALDPSKGGVAEVVATSADDARSSVTPAFLPIVGDRDRERVEWTAHEKVLSVDRLPGMSRLLIAPVDAAGLPGALTLHYDDAAEFDAQAARAWLPEQARALEELYGVVRTRADVARQNLRLRSLIRTALTLQATRDPIELEQMLVTDSLTVAGAEWAVLVRWDPTARTGRVTFATPTAERLGVAFDALVVTPDSLVGQVCTDGQPKVFADARPYTRGSDQVFGGAAPPARLGSLLAVPLRRSDVEQPIGALVCGHREVAVLRAMEARNAKNLAVIAAGALETAWAVEDARRNARTDPLTGLLNRRGFEERFAQVVAETDRYGGTCAVVFADIDHFKRVNDTYGHDAGDAVLVAVAQAMADGRRTVDATARLGGEELVVLLPQTDTAGAREVAERLRHRIEMLHVITQVGEVRVTASFGVAAYKAREGRPERVIERADQALYAAKHGGRNRVEVNA